MSRHMSTDVLHDPFARCEDACNHDLAAGLTLAELLGGDGPNAPVWVVSGFRLPHLTPVDDEALAS